MEKKFLKGFISLIMCVAIISTQAFAKTEKTSCLIRSLGTHNEYDINCIVDDSHNHEHDFIENDKNSYIYNQEGLNVDSQNILFADNVDLYNGNQVKPPSSQITSYQNNVLSTSMLEDKIFEYELFFAAQLMKKDMDDISYSSIIYDLDNRPLYYLVEFTSGGYVIILRTHSIPIELSYTSKGSPYPKTIDTKKYYVGMLSYAVESNGQIVMLSDKKPLSLEEKSTAKKACAKLLTNVSNEYKKYNRQTSSLRQADIQALYMQGTFSIKVQNADPIVEVPNAAYFSNAPFGYNGVGNCGPTAAAMLMRYYDDNINSDIIDMPLLNHLDNEWRDELLSYSSNGRVSSTYVEDEVDKVNVYFGEKKPDLLYCANYYTDQADYFSKVLIEEGTPFVFYAEMDLPYRMSHAVLAYGYQNYSIGFFTSTMFKIHTGWHGSEGANDEIPGCPNVILDENKNVIACNGGERNDVWLTSYHPYSILYIDKISSSHTHDFKYSSETTTPQLHQLICSCGLKKRVEYHSSISIENETGHSKVCKTCNYIISDCKSSFIPATCLSPKKCSTCYETFGTILGHSYGTATCTSPAKCIRCDVTTGTSLGHDYRSATCVTPKICIRCDSSFGSSLGHDYSSATCTTASKCSRCGATTGTSLGHNYSSATCTTASKCTRCGVTTGTSLGHNYSSATCTTASKCTRCGVTTGTSLGHNYSLATCTTASKCSRCGATTGTSLGHSYSAATCTIASKCSRCGITTGTSLGHSYSAATCTSPKKCTRCGVTTGTALGHDWSYGTCTYKFCDICGTSSGSTTHNWISGTCTYKSCSKCGSSTGTSTHSYNAATCMLPKTCRNCGATSGTKLGHNFVRGKCTRCPISINRSNEYE